MSGPFNVDNMSLSSKKEELLTGGIDI